MEGSMKHRFLVIFLVTIPILAGAQALRQPAIPRDFAEQQREESSDKLPKELQQVSIDQKLNAQITLDLKFRDESGTEQRLGEYFSDDKPVLLVMAYYNCPMLCTQVLNGVLGALKAVPLEAGKDFHVVVVSIDPHESSELARQKKTSYLEQYHRTTAEGGWHFLTGDSLAIRQLAEEIGFRYVYDPVAKQYAHASGIMILTPQGKLSRYFYGIEYAPKLIKLALVEASENKIGTLADKLYLYCFHYDPSTGKYGLAIMSAVRVSGALFVLGIIAFLFYLRRRTLVKSRLLELTALVFNLSSIPEQHRGRCAAGKE
jgi:protein SCO1